MGRRPVVSGGTSSRCRTRPVAPSFLPDPLVLRLPAEVSPNESSPPDSILLRCSLAVPRVCSLIAPPETSSSPMFPAQ